MRATSGRSKVIGVVGLLWFLFFSASAVSTIVWPREKEPGVPWTKRELLIGSACLLCVGCAGAVLAVRRLIFLLFARSPKIGGGAAAPLLSMRVELKYEQFGIYQEHIVPRAMRRAVAIALIFVVAMYGVMWRMRGNSTHSELHFLVIISAGMAMAIFTGRRVVLWFSSLTWNGSPWLRGARTYEFFEEGILVHGHGGTRAVQWEHVKRAETLGEVVSLVVSRDWYLFPTWALSRAEIDQLISLLKIKVRRCSL